MARNTVIVSVTSNISGLRKGMSDAGGVMGRLSSVAKTATKTVVGIGTALAGLAFGKGISRAIGLDEATTQLKALGYSGKATAAIMDSALRSVKGTAFGLQDAATVAASALASNVKPGKDLDRQLAAITNTAALARVGMTEMGAIYNKVSANMKVTTAEMNQLADRGVPVWQYLSKSIGVTVPELRKMIEKGKVTSDMFINAMAPAVDGIATTMGGSFKGSVQNALAALGRFGAAWVVPGLPIVKAGMTEFMVIVDGLTSRMKPLTDRFAAWAAKVNVSGVGESVLKFLNAMVKQAPAVIAFIRDLSPVSAVLRAIVPVLGQLAPLWEALGRLLQALVPVATELASAVGDALSAAAVALLGVLVKLLPLLTGLLNYLADNIGIVKAVAIAVAAGTAAWVAYRGVLAGISFVKLIIGLVTKTKAFIAATIAKTKDLAVTAALVAMYAKDFVVAVARTIAGVVKSTAVWIAHTAALVATKVAMLAVKVALGVATIAQRAFNLVMNANPIMLVVTAIGTLVTGLTWFFTQTEIGRKIWEAFTTFLTVAWNTVVAFFTETLGGIAAFFTETWTNISTFFTEIFTGISTFFTDTWNGVVAFFTDSLTAIGTFFTDTWNNIVAFLTGVWNGILNTVTSWGAAIWNAISSAWNKVIAFFKQIPGWIGGVFSSAGAWLVNAGRNIINGLSNGVVAIWNTVTAFFKAIPGKVGGFFAGAGKWLWDAGRNIVQGLLDGIGNLAGKIGEWFLNLIPDWIKGPFKWALGIKSPSRVFKGYGQNIGQGLINGMRGMAGVVRDATAGLSDTVTDNFKPKLDLPGIDFPDPGDDAPRGPWPGFGGPPPAAGGAAQRIYQITINTLTATAEVGRAVKNAIREYEEAGGRA